MFLGGAAAMQQNAGSFTPMHTAQLQVALWAIRDRVQGMADMLQSLEKPPSAANDAPPYGLADLSKPWPGSGPHHPNVGLDRQGPNHSNFEPMFAPAVSATQLPNIGGSLVYQSSASTVPPDLDEDEDSPENTANTLRGHLQRVRQYPGRIVVVRGIAKLGFEAQSLLEKHFAAYGGVTEVLVAHSKVKSACDRGRTRPGNMGLVVLKSAEAQQQILAEGDQWVMGVRVVVKTFDHKIMKSNLEQADAPDRKIGWGNQVRNCASMYIRTDERNTNGEDTPPGDSLDGYSPGKAPLSQKSTQSSSNNSDGGFTYSVASGSIEEPQDLGPPIGLQHTSAQYRHPGSNNRVPPAAVTPPPGLVGPMKVDPTQLRRNMPHKSDAPEDDGRGRSNHDGHQQPSPPQHQRRESQCCKTVQLTQGTLCSHLTLLQQEDQSCVFITRHINKLGFRSRDILHKHYSQLTQGQVCRVLVAHSKSKPYYDSKDQLRTRPGGLGFVVMKNAAVVEQILALGEYQQIGTHKILVRPFEKPKEKSCWTDQVQEA